ncbi:MAG: hypothetical protein IT169_12470 [Bryobacterales bacterium]|nr:hypothetical protein [Bryobacterales bacterium]
MARFPCVPLGMALFLHRARAWRVSACLAACLLLVCVSRAQVIEFESGGSLYQTLSREGLTVMFTRLPGSLRAYGVLQVSVANGSGQPRQIKPEDFSLERPNGRVSQAMAAADVVRDFIRNPNRDDIIKLVGTYELSLYGMSPRVGSRNGYETRRQSAIAELSFKNLKAATAASAIAFVSTKLAPGETTDGAIFFSIVDGPIDGARVVVRTEDGLVYRFNPLVASTPALTP